MENVRLILLDFFITLLFNAGGKFYPVIITNTKSVIDSPNHISNKHFYVTRLEETS